jgi:hypothetical protein
VPNPSHTSTGKASLYARRIPDRNARENHRRGMGIEEYRSLIFDGYSQELYQKFAYNYVVRVEIQVGKSSLISLL